MIPDELQAKLDAAHAEVEALTTEAKDLDATIRRLEAELKAATQRRHKVCGTPWQGGDGLLSAARGRLAAAEREVNDHERVKVAGYVVVAAGPKRVTLRVAGREYTRTMDRANLRPYWADAPIDPADIEAAIADFAARRKAGKETA